MHAREPMHVSSSAITMPSSRRLRAPEGQAVTHGASSQWLHSTGR